MPSVYLSPSTQEYNIYYDGNGSEEYYMNLIADAMEPYLEASKITFSRNDPDQSLSRAISDSNAGNYDLHLALHSNASPESMPGSLRGSDFYYFTASERGKRAANVLADNFKSIYPNPNLVRALPTMLLAEVRRTSAPAVLAELAYHDNTSDAEWIRGNVDAIARNLVQGLCEYFGIPFNIPEAPEYDRIAVVTTRGGRLNIRSRPSTSARVLAQIPNGERVTVIDAAGDWYLIEYNGIIGFVSGEYITLITREG
ncbi:MAG: SH3 domain-containing protein [Clostridia bacterium]|nr:SH3 domain-containing protein [Clostridia bacterium]